MGDLEALMEENEASIVFFFAPLSKAENLLLKMGFLLEHMVFL